MHVELWDIINRKRNTLVGNNGTIMAEMDCI